ncbi:hypothetical protein DFH08DRAFT_961676 [Mycena albidolilacea]|uniref:Uncharacterized protein n=1 Tax=Mycena albidolilacea TaxID=1033008 RepID=A0AAD7A050_9AGAR|nr:hypothetical protein DFH08DRAFT_961676 [Mycena albidolilacea]
MRAPVHARLLPFVHANSVCPRLQYRVPPGLPPLSGPVHLPRPPPTTTYDVPTRLLVLYTTLSALASQFRHSRLEIATVDGDALHAKRKHMTNGSSLSLTTTPAPSSPAARPWIECAAASWLSRMTPKRPREVEIGRLSYCLHSTTSATFRCRLQWDRFAVSSSLFFSHRPPLFPSPPPSCALTLTSTLALAFTSSLAANLVTIGSSLFLARYSATAFIRSRWCTWLAWLALYRRVPPANSTSLTWDNRSCASVIATHFRVYSWVPNPVASPSSSSIPSSLLS